MGGAAGSRSAINVGFDLEAKIDSLTAGTDCTPNLSALRCTISTNASLVFGGTHTDADADAELEMGDTVVLDTPAVGISTSAPCLPPLSLYQGGTAEVDNMTLSLTN